MKVVFREPEGIPPSFLVSLTFFFESVCRVVQLHELPTVFVLYLRNGTVIITPSVGTEPESFRFRGRHDQLGNTCIVKRLAMSTNDLRQQAMLMVYSPRPDH